VLVDRMEVAAARRQTSTSVFRPRASSPGPARYDDALAQRRAGMLAVVAGIHLRESLRPDRHPRQGQQDEAGSAPFTDDL
jgi:hypothetical protein